MKILVISDLKYFLLYSFRNIEALSIYIIQGGAIDKITILSEA